MYQTLNFFNSTKQLKKVLEKNDILFTGKLIRHDNNDIVWLKKNEDVQRFLSDKKINDRQVFANKEGNLGVICDIHDNDFQPIRYHLVPKLKKFLTKLEYRILEKNEQLKLNDIVKEVENSYSIDLNIIMNSIIPEKTQWKHKGENGIQKTYLDGLTIVFDKETNFIRKFTMKFTPMILNFIKQENFFNKNCENPIVFSSETIESLYEDTHGNSEIIDEYVEDCNTDLLKLLNNPRYLKILGQNLDWRGSNGYKLLTLQDGDNLIKKLMPNYDHTMFIRFDLETHKPYTIVYSHDCPTGSFLTFEEITEEEI